MRLGAGDVERAEQSLAGHGRHATVRAAGTPAVREPEGRHEAGARMVSTAVAAGAAPPIGGGTTRPMCRWRAFRVCETVSRR